MDLIIMGTSMMSEWLCINSAGIKHNSCILVLYESNIIKKILPICKECIFVSMKTIKQLMKRKPHKLATRTIGSFWMGSWWDWISFPVVLSNSRWDDWLFCSTVYWWNNYSNDKKLSMADIAEKMNLEFDDDLTCIFNDNNAEFFFLVYVLWMKRFLKGNH